MLAIKDILAIARDDEALRYIEAIARSMRNDDYCTEYELRNAKRKRKEYAEHIRDRIERIKD